MAAPPRQAYHQDYMVRVRYSNHLPPPPMPPKLLDIPNTGLSSGQYTSAGFASRLAREQTLNVEADAELGMPIDLVGIPGVFDNDESAIQAHDNPAPLHPRDKALLRPLSTLGKPTSHAHGVSFLRRTEYITAGAAGAARLDAKPGYTRQVKRRRQDVSKDDPVFIMRSVMKGFDIAYPQDAYTGPDKPDMLRSAEITPDEKSAWMYPRHPTKGDVKLLDSYPIIPDIEGLPIGPGYNVVRFGAPPLPYAPADKYEDRLDVGILRAISNPTIQNKYEARKVADPSFRGAPEFDYEYFLPNAGSVQGIKRKFSVADPERDSTSLYDTHDTDTPCFRYDKLRSYETTHQNIEVGDDVDRFDENIVISLHDKATSSTERSLQKGAYVYPVVGRISLKPKRDIRGPGGRTAQPQDDEGVTPPVDMVEIRARDPDADEEATRQAIKEKVFEVSAQTVEA